MNKVTKRQKEVLVAIDRLSLHFPPTLRELGAELGITTHAAADQVKLIAKKKLVTWTPNKSRTLYLTEAGREQIKEEFL